jgi:hypothetical protein
MNYQDVFKIREKNSGKALDVRGVSMGNKACLIQYKDNNGDNQKFAAFSLDDGCFILAAMHSGRVLDVSGGSQNSKVPIIQYDYHGGDNQRFEFEDAGNGYCTIKAKHSGKALDVRGGSQASDVPIIQYDYHGGDNQKFKLEKVGTLKVPTRSEETSLGDIPRFTDYGQILQDSQPVIVGQVSLPYFLVRDTLPRNIQIKTSPYYKLTHEQYWKKVLDDEFTGSETLKQTYTFKSGMERTKRQSFEKLTSMSVGLDFGLKFEAVSLGFQSKISSELKHAISTEEKSLEEREETLEVEITPKGRLAYAGFVLIDRFSLERANGTKIGDTWEIVHNDLGVRRESYPHEAKVRIAFKPRAAHA